MPELLGQMKTSYHLFIPCPAQQALGRTCRAGSMKSVLGLVPAECQCRDLELDCNGAHFKDVPTVSTNVTMIDIKL
ncbi:relaxin receptor 1 [Silurus meridionalis]|nr:relaxin receptor 1 [Silurus meridionalis]